MYEFGTCEAVVAEALRRAAGRRVSAVRVRVGGHPVDPDVVTQGIQLAAAGTVAEGAAVDLVLDPMWVHCYRCGGTGAMTEHRTILACPGCGSVDIDVTGSDEVVLESISMIDTEPGHAGDEERAGNLSGPLLVVGARTTG